MTIVVTLVNKYGVWQSTDHRIINRVTGMASDNYAAKQVYSNHPNGAMLIGWAGVGTMVSPVSGRDVPLAQWVCDALRKDHLSIEQGILELQKQATHDLGQGLLDAKVEHYFTACGFSNGEAFYYLLRNSSGTSTDLSKCFSLEGGPLCKISLNNGPTGQSAVASIIPKWGVVPGDVKSINAAAKRRPRAPEEFSEMLADVNRRVAARKGPEGNVSPHCTVCAMAPEGDVTVNSFDMPADAPLIPLPMVLLGIDFTDIEAHGMETVTALHERREVEDRSEELGRESIRAKNRLYDK